MASLTCVGVPDVRQVDYGHSKGAQMGWYDNNCICMDSYAVAQDPGG